MPVKNISFVNLIRKKLKNLKKKNYLDRPSVLIVGNEKIPKACSSRIPEHFKDLFEVLTEIRARWIRRLKDLDF